MRLNELSPVLWLLLFFAVCLGCVIGSFLNVVVWRVPRGESLVSPPSHCPNCGHRIRAWENIPVISWLCLKGRCSSCHLPISIRYPLGELATGITYAVVTYAAYRRNLPVAVLPGYYYVLAALICVTQIDIRHHIIPNIITYTGMAYALILSFALPLSHAVVEPDIHSAASGTLLLRLVAQMIQSLFHLESPLSPHILAPLDAVLGLLTGVFLLGIFAAAGAFLQRRRPELPALMGWGDVKFLAMMGAFFGADACLYITCLASLLGWLYGMGKKLVAMQNAQNAAVRNSRGRQNNAEPLKHEPVSVPFGPMLSIAAFVWMLIGTGTALL